MTTMTERQESYLRRLVMDTIAPELGEAWGLDPALACDRFVASVEGKSEASRVIDELQSAPRADGRASNVEPPEGVHYLRDGDTIEVYKVQRAVHGSGKLYAKHLHPGPPPTWEYVGRNGAFSRLGDDTLLDLETAKEFGRLYGACGVCGRTLTDEVSIERGIGPVCFGKMGG